MSIILDLLRESIDLLNKMSAYLLFGFVFAGILHVFIDTKTIARHLGYNKLSSVVKASLFGVPLPLCSCGVIPATIQLKKDGASRGAILSFLISTPTTGIDSIFATYALLGPIFTVYRVVASFLSGIFAGVLANIFFRKEPPVVVRSEREVCKDCGQDHNPLMALPFRSKVKSVFTYSFGTLLGESGLWILLGIFIGGAVSYFIPSEFVENYLGSAWISMFIMLLVGIPMYICSSGSVPIVAAFIIKGMNPAAAFVFLLAGPATNSVALTVIAKELGKKTTIIFLGAVIFCALFFGLILNFLFDFFNIDLSAQLLQVQNLVPAYLEYLASFVLVLLIVLNLFKKSK